MLYAETLIGRDTISTMPLKTMEGFLDHGVTSQSLAADVEGAGQILSTPKDLGIDLASVAAALVVEGIEKFCGAAGTLFDAIARTCREIHGRTERADEAKPLLCGAGHQRAQFIELVWSRAAVR
ncbi:hypothetical protein KRR38_31845 [Novosphingobium sp. G106]|uniref:transaldolase family protein n=1 Tax=Novosphingobium sp. G106 TaxID=2849500 RepID=UPI001C2DE3B0|nr:transaldolase family protein [Novosphingobium sp. G106]MBV1691824.1 hypothetical protein [Novosphingobium sp. G106]MBV1692139.1 hypothetical protein [Novosphingobium sp. G106]